MNVWLKALMAVIVAAATILLVLAVSTKDWNAVWGPVCVLALMGLLAWAARREGRW